MKPELAMPSAGLAKRLLSEVEYGQRLTGVSMHCLHGPTEVDIYSFKTAVGFLYMDSIESLKDPTSGATMGYIDPQALTWWLGNVFGDHALVKAIDTAVGGLEHFTKMLVPMKRLMSLRLEQCETVVGSAPVPA